MKRRPPLSTLEPPERDSAPVLADPWGPLAEPSTLEGGWPSWFGCWQQNLVHMLYPYQCFGIPQRAGRQHSVGAVEGSVQFRHRSDFWLSLGYPGGRAEGKDNRHYGPARACLALRYCIHRIKLPPSIPSALSMRFPWPLLILRLTMRKKLLVRECWRRLCQGASDTAFSLNSEASRSR